MTPIGVLESCLYSEDLATAEAFYTRVLGLALYSKVEGRHVFFHVGEQMVLVFNPIATEIPSPPGKLTAPTHGARGPGHLCLTAAEGSLDEWRAHLAREGVAIEAEVAWPHGPVSLYLRDPAGNSLEIAEKQLWFRE